MPFFGGILEKDEIDAVLEHVVSRSNGNYDAARADAGTVLFEDNCSACHGEKGLGDHEQGAPNLGTF